jgi:hypothetical protein
MSEAYATWLNGYGASVEELDIIQKSQDAREDYHDPSQAYADYLDYIEEWEWHASEKKAEVLSKFIHTAGQRHLKIQCICGTNHVLTYMEKSRPR